MTTDGTGESTEVSDHADYEAAFRAWDESEDPQWWDRMAADGLD